MIIYVFYCCLNTILNKVRLNVSWRYCVIFVKISTSKAYKTNLTITQRSPLFSVCFFFFFHHRVQLDEPCVQFSFVSDSRDQFCANKRQIETRPDSNELNNWLRLFSYFPCPRLYDNNKKSKSFCHYDVVYEFYKSIVTGILIYIFDHLEKVYISNSRTGECWGTCTGSTRYNPVKFKQWNNI